jgi:hypothetical protein
LSALGRIRLRRAQSAPRPGMVRAEDVARARGAAGAGETVQPAPADRDLLARRDRLAERLTMLQLELGGLFYEMAIRDHVRMEVLVPKAAALQRVDAELGQVERLLQDGEAGLGGNCPACGAIYARGAAFCSQCAQPLTAP